MLFPHTVHVERHRIGSAFDQWPAGVVFVYDPDGLLAAQFDRGKKTASWKNLRYDIGDEFDVRVITHDETCLDETRRFRVTGNEEDKTAFWLGPGFDETDEYVLPKTGFQYGVWIEGAVPVG